MKCKPLIGAIAATIVSPLLAGCATTEPYPLLQSGAPQLESGSVVLTGVDGNLYVVAAGRQLPVQLTSGATDADADPVVGYLGNAVAGGGMVMGSVDLRGGSSILHGSGQPFYSAWAPDGGSLLTHVGAPQSRSGSVLSLQAVDDREFEKRLAPPLGLSAGIFQSPAYASDGSGRSWAGSSSPGSGHGSRPW